MESYKQKLTGGLTIGGAVLFVFGLVLWLTVFGNWSAVAVKNPNPIVLLVSGLPLGMCLIGAFLCGLGIYIGYRSAFGDNFTPVPSGALNAYVVAKFILSNDGDFVHDPELFEPEELKYIVQIEFSDGTKKEFETDPFVYAGIGEGQHGDVEYQGHMLTRFEFVPPMAETKEPARRP